MGIPGIVEIFGADSWAPAEDDRLFTPLMTRMLGLGEPSTSGIEVNEWKALNLSAVWCAITIIGNTMAILPASAYKPRKPDGREELPDHIVGDLLHRRPNPLMRAGQFKWLLAAWRRLWGRGCAEIERERNGDAKALWPIHPSRVQAKVDGAGKYYEVLLSDNTAVRIDDRNMFDVLNYTDDGLNGISTIGAARNSLGLSLATEQHGASTFKNGATPPTVIEWDLKFPDDEAVANWRRSWQATYGGSENAGKIGVLEQGMKAHVLGMPNDDAQFLETRKFQIPEIARWFIMAPHRLKDLDRATFNNIEELSRESIDDIALPEAHAWEEEANEKLFPENERKRRFFIKFNVDALLRGRYEERQRGIDVQLKNGKLSLNEARALDDQNPLPPEIGDARLVPSTMKPIDQIVEPPPEPAPPPMLPPPPPDEGEPEPEEEQEPPAARAVAVFGPLLNEAIARLERKESMATARAEKRYAADTGGLSAWRDDFRAKQRPEIEAALLPVFVAALAYAAPQVSEACREALAKEHAELAGADPFRVGQFRESMIASLVSQCVEVEYEKKT